LDLIPKLARLAAAVMAVLFLSGCSKAISIPETIPATAQKVPICLDYPLPPAQLRLVSDLPGMMRLAGYSGDNFVSGGVDTSNQDWTPQIERGDHQVALIQRAGTPVKANQDFQNLWKLLVSDSQPFQLEIVNQKAEGHWNLSGLPVTHLRVEAGDAKNAFTFDEANPGLMQSCEIYGSSGEVVLEGILNAGCKEIFIEAGEGPLILRLNGKELSQDLQVGIDGGGGPIKIEVMREAAARFTINSHTSVIPGEGLVKIANHGESRVYETSSYNQSGVKKIDISISGDLSEITINLFPN
jgi:hypothetical protein